MNKAKFVEFLRSLHRCSVDASKDGLRGMYVASNFQQQAIGAIFGALWAGTLDQDACMALSKWIGRW